MRGINAKEKAVEYVEIVTRIVDREGWIHRAYRFFVVASFH